MRTVFAGLMLVIATACEGGAPIYITDPPVLKISPVSLVLAGTESSGGNASVAVQNYTSSVRSLVITGIEASSPLVLTPPLPVGGVKLRPLESKTLSFALNGAPGRYSGYVRFFTDTQFPAQGYYELPWAGEISR